MKYLLLFILITFAARATIAIGVTYDPNTKQVSPSGLVFSNAFTGLPTVGTNLANKDYVDSVAGGGATPSALYDLLSPWARAQYYGLTTLYTIGDSQTVGQLGGGTYPFAPGGTLLAAYRYADQLAATNGLTLSNYAVSGSGQLYPQLTAGVTQSHLNQIGHYLDAPTWSGVVTTLAGYNDAYSNMSSDAWVRASRLANVAMIGRLLVTNYVNLSNGKTATGATDGTYATDGVVLSGGSNPTLNPFPWGNTAANDRDVLTLKSGQRVAITPSAGTTILFYELTTTGGTASVYVNGTNIANLDTTLTAPATTNRMPAALVIPYGTYAITITNTSGTNNLMALGQLPAPSSVTNRVIIVGAPAQLSGNRSRSVAENIGRAAYGAAVQFADWPVYFADPNELLDPTMDIVSTSDPDHFNPGGQRKIYQAFINAVRVTQPSRRNTFAGALGEQVSINGTATGTMALGFARQGTNRLEMSINSSGDLVATMYDATGASLGSAMVLTQAGRLTIGGGLAAAGGVSAGGVPTAPAYDHITSWSDSGVGYSGSFAGGTFGTTRPWYFYANGWNLGNVGTINGATFNSPYILAPGSGTSLGWIAGWGSDPNGTARITQSRTLAQVKGDMSLNLVENTAISTWTGSTNLTTIGTLNGIKSTGGGSFGGVMAAVPFDNVSLYSSAGFNYIASFTNGSVVVKLPLVIQADGLLLSFAGPISGATFSDTISSTLVTGNQPLTIASTTKVNNLNADFFDNLNSTDFQPASANLTNVAALTAQSLPSTIIAATENAQTGTTYTVAISDNGKVVTLNNASAITVTVPTLSAGFSCSFIQKGAGQVTFTTSGTTISNAHSQTKTFGQYSVVTIYGLSSTVFVLAGDTGP